MERTRPDRSPSWGHPHAHLFTSLADDHMLQRSKETTLRHDLLTMRDAIDKFYSDKNRYPETLDELVERQYLKAIPPDPVTERADTWVITLPPNIDEQGSVFDVHSGSARVAEDGTPYALW